MKKIRLTYAPLQNAGDLLNKDLVERLSGRQVVCSKVHHADMMAIGGALVGAQYGKTRSRRLCQRFFRLIYGNKPLYVWGSGFFRDDNDHPMSRDNLKVCALRGAMTKARLEMLTGKNYDVPLADAGLLSNLYVEGTPEKVYDVGIVPHFSQQEDPQFQELKSSFSSACIIDIRLDPKTVINQIAKCNYILSSSLHGLIFADGLGIANLHVLGQPPLTGGSFKFEDYYSSYGLPHEPWSLDEKFPKVEDIIARYRVSETAVKEKQQQLLDCFPKDI